jgi:hypothetical protein
MKDGRNDKPLLGGALGSNDGRDEPDGFPDGVADGLDDPDGFPDGAADGADEPDGPCA